MDELYAKNVIDTVMNKLHEEQAQENEERMKNIKRKEFQICTKYGSRITRWELVIDEETHKKIYINVDTMKVQLSIYIY